MKRVKISLKLALVVLCLVNGAGLLVTASDSAGRPAPDGLSAGGWLAIQSQLAKLVPPDDEGMAYFGDSVSVSGDTAVVGASQEDAPSYMSGAAFVFYRNEGGPNAWGQVAKLSADEPTGMETFGSSVWVDGDTIMVGAPGADVGDNPLQGVVYVFYRNQGAADAWGQVAKLIAGDGAEEDEFGGSLAVSGDTAVVGAEGADVGGNADQGAAYVFYRDKGGADAWGQAAKLTAGDGAEEDLFGAAVALSGDTALVGSEEADIGREADQGAAYLFSRDEGGADAWGQVAKLTAGDGAEEDFFGASVALSGDIALVGSEGAEIGGNVDQGAAYLFSRDEGGAGAWGQAAKLTAGDGAEDDRFGAAVAVSGDTALVGSEGADIGDNVDQGAAYLFSRDEGGAGAWGQTAKLTAGDGAGADEFGGSVAVSGDTAVMGAVGAITPSNIVGAAYVFALKPAASHLIYLPLLQRNN